MRNLFMATVAAVALTVPATAGETTRVTDTEIPIGTLQDGKWVQVGTESYSY